MSLPQLVMSKAEPVTHSIGFNINLPWSQFIPLLIIYFIPTAIALYKGHGHKVGIILLNVLLGWTVLFWGAALIWCYVPVKK